MIFVLLLWLLTTIHHTRVGASNFSDTIHPTPSSKSTSSFQLNATDCTLQSTDSEFFRVSRSCQSEYGSWYSEQLSSSLRASRSLLAGLDLQSTQIIPLFFDSSSQPSCCGELYKRWVESTTHDVRRTSMYSASLKNPGPLLSLARFHMFRAS